METRSKKLLAFIIIAILLLAGGYYFINSRLAVQRFISLSQAARTSYVQGNSTDAVVMAQNAVDTAGAVGNTNYSAQSQILLADALFSRNQSGDRQNAATLLKQIASDSKVGPMTRARALAHLAEWFTLASPDVMKQFVFNTSPYDGYLASANGNVASGTVHLLQQSNAVSPNPEALYLMAAISARLIGSQGNVDAADPTQVANAQSVKIEIMQGDALFSTASSTYDALSLTYMYLNRTTALAVISPFFSDITNQIIDASYEKTLSAADSDPSSNVLQYYGLITRLNYAVGLNAREHGTQNAKIEQLLSTISESNNPAFNQYVLLVKSRVATSYFHNQVLNLRVLSPEFSAYLTRIGWN